MSPEQTHTASPAAAVTGLGKSLRPRHVEMISIGGIIGAGLFVGSSAAIAATGPIVILSYLIAGAVMLFVMRMLAEMAVARTDLAAFTELIRAGLGDWAGFVSGWLYWYFWVVVVAIEAIAGAVILAPWLGAPAWVIGVVLLSLLTAVNLMSTRAFGEFEYWFSMLKVVAIIAFIAVVGAFAFGVTSPTGPTFGNLIEHGGFAPFGLSAMLAGVTTVIFALTGAEIATIAAAESPEPSKVIARLTVSVVVRIALFYVVSIALILSVTPWTAIVPGESPFATALEVLNIPYAALLMKGVVLVAVLSCLNSGLYVTSRVLFVLAARGDAPQALVRTNRSAVPVRAILLASAFGFAALGASVASPKTVFAFLVTASGAIMLIVYLMLCFAQIRLRRRLEAEKSGPLKVRMWLFPYLSYAVAGAIVAVLLAMLLTPDLAAQFWASSGCAAVALAAYALRRRFGGPGPAVATAASGADAPPRPEVA